MNREILEAGVRAGACPGGVLALGHRGGAPEVLAFGRTGGDNGQPVATDTIYDVASLTKPMATVAVVMKLCAAKKMALSDRLDRYVPALGGRVDGVTIRHVLGHAAGFPAHIKLYEQISQNPGSGSPRERLLELAAGVPLEATPGTRAVYSDIGFILLGAACETAGGARLDVLAERLVFAPLEMRSTQFVDLLATPPRTLDAAPTYYKEGTAVASRVHDDNARAGGGIFGHAGVFSTAADVARFCATMATLAAGNDAGGFDAALARELFSTSAAPDTTWRLGWDTPARDRSLSHAGTLWPETGLGHLGFTGCSMWIEPERGAYAVLLTNRVLIDAAPATIRDFRRQVMNAAWSHLSSASDVR